MAAGGTKSALKKSALKQAEAGPEAMVGVGWAPAPTTALSSAAVMAPMSFSMMKPSDDELDEFVTTLKTQVWS